jgi:acetoin utilization deacetylase AcuC-like enzyme
VHTQDHIQFLEESCGSKNSGYLDGDTPFSSSSFHAARLASGAGIFLADQVLGGGAKNGFALVRPPGHHAEEDHAMGFCLFNHIAVTAEYLKSQGIQKICILDWDVHHGNGTQNHFYADGSVYFTSFHQFPFYPGSGATEEKGEGPGLGATLNVPLPRGSGKSEYDRAWNLFEKEMDFFQPEFVLVSAGFDAHSRDPLGGMNLETRDFENFSIRIQALAETFAKGRLISFLEGGYDFGALGDSVRAHVEVLSS